VSEPTIGRSGVVFYGEMGFQYIWVTAAKYFEKQIISRSLIFSSQNIIITKI
jgi:hypothetical protein